MKIMLIHPPTPHYARISTGWDFAIGNIGSFPPYGLLSLAAYIREYRNDEIKILDCIAEGYDLEAVRQQMVDFQPDVVGISASTYTWYDVLQAGKMTRKTFPKVHIIIGGPHVHLFPEETITHPEIDSLVLGEGEIPIRSLLERLENNQSYDDLPGVVTKANKHIKPTIPVVQDINTLPYPAYDLVDREKYRGVIGSGGKMICILSTRGCPFSCTFCQVLVKRYRALTIENLIKLIRHYYDEGYREFYFFDDLFNVTMNRVIDFSKAVIESGMKISFVFRGRVDGMSEEMLRMAAKAGCTNIIVGVEDATDEGLKKIKKVLTIQQVKTAIQWAHKYGIEINTNWILGLPEHKTVEDVKHVAEMAIKLKSDFAQFSILQLLPGCKMYEDAVEEGVIKREDWINYAKNPVPDYQIKPYDKYLSIEQLTELYKYCEERFYKRFSFIGRRISRLRNLEQLNRMIKPAVQILFK